MPRPKSKVPAYRFHKPSGLAYVRIDGRMRYLGKHGSDASLDEYRKLLAELKSVPKSRRPQETGPDRCVTIVELIRDYVVFAEKFYARSNELSHIKYALKPLREMYGRTIAESFGPLKLEAVREAMIQQGLSRPGINKRMHRIRRVFKWGVSKELLSADVYLALKTLEPLKEGYTEAPETKPVKPIPEAFVDAIELHVLPQVWAMIQLQRLTGMRPGEATRMRTCDIDTVDDVWVYRPSKHKNQFRGKSREIYIGPRAKAVLKPWLKTDLQAFLFSPREAMEWQRKQRDVNRKTRLPSRRGVNRVKRPKRRLSDQYTVSAYRNAIQAACRKADVPEWSPNQLRHNSGTQLRREFGVEIARVVLGHSKIETTQIYAEEDRQKAIQVMSQVG